MPAQKRTRRTDKNRLYIIDHLRIDGKLHYASTLDDACNTADRLMTYTGHSILISWAATGEIVAARIWIPKDSKSHVSGGKFWLFDFGYYTDWRFYSRRKMG